MDPILLNLDALQIRMILIWAVSVGLLALGLAALINCRWLTPMQWPAGLRLRDAVLSSDPEQRTLMLRYLVGLLNAMAGVLALNFGVARGAIDADDCHWLTLGAVLSGVVWMVVMRTGWNRRLPDPSLAEPQMMTAIVFLGWGYVIGGPGRPIALMLLFIILMFSMFKVTTSQLVRCSALSTVVFAAAFIKVAHDQRHVRFEADMQAVYFAVLVIILISMCLLITYLNQVRSRSHRRKHELASALARIQELAIRDELTGLFNRRHMMELLHLERSRAERSGQSWCVCLIDLDHFKVVNDRHGHGVGDEVLRAVAQVVRDGLCDSDQVARWGGEEFLIVFPHTQPDEAVLVMERIRQSLAAAGVSRTVPELRVTFSGGVASALPAEGLPQLVDRADQALYRAKATGRNRTLVHTLASPPLRQPLAGVR